VLAARLTEDPGVSVALVEAGLPDTAAEIHIPAAFPALFKTRWDWDFDSESEPELGARGAFLAQQRADLLGGELRSPVPPFHSRRRFAEAGGGLRDLIRTFEIWHSRYGRSAPVRIRRVR
jgi:hypothetical protein